uniref:Uncharacterized protein n=1 Tax=viral metagenome TaxID=1070528 RepID=A0A6M3ISQ2_9ZZZZ
MVFQEYVDLAKQLLPGTADDKIKGIVAVVFKDLCSREDWQFMLVPDPVVVSFVSSQEDYDVEISAFRKVFQLEWKGTSDTTWRPIDYVQWVDYNKVKTGEIVANKTPIWTWKGRLANGKQRFGFYPTPGAEYSQFRLIYFAEGSASMISRLDDSWAGVVLDGVQKYLIADPNFKIAFMQQYEAGVRRMITREPIITRFTPPFMIDYYVAQRMIDNADENY